MARINIEDSIFKEASWTDLCIAAGSRITAMGALVWLFIEAQKYYLTFGEIPTEEWVKCRLPDYLIDTGWAERTSTGVTARGQEKQFAWLVQASGAGKASAEARAKVAAERRKGSTPVDPAFNARSTPVEQPCTSSSSSSSEDLGREQSPAAPVDLGPPPVGVKTRKPRIKPAGGPSPWDLFDLWNANAHERLPRIEIEKVNEKGKRFTRATEALRKNPEIEYWTDLITVVNSKKFCLGHNDRKWRADIDWLLQADVPAKLYEGKYDRV